MTWNVGSGSMLCASLCDRHQSWPHDVLCVEHRSAAIQDDLRNTVHVSLYTLLKITSFSSESKFAKLLSDQDGHNCLQCHWHNPKNELLPAVEVLGLMAFTKEHTHNFHLGPSRAEQLCLLRNSFHCQIIFSVPLLSSSFHFRLVFHSETVPANRATPSDQLYC